MAKIHIKGGSPLRLEFEDDKGTTLKVHLEDASKGEYWVINEATNKKIQTHQDGGKNIFRETNPTTKTCEISYMEKERAFA